MAIATKDFGLFIEGETVETDETRELHELHELHEHPCGRRACVVRRREARRR